MCDLVLIEDDVLAARRVRGFISRLDGPFRLAGVAECGSAGVELVETVRPDVLLLDIELPDFSGFEVLERLLFRPTVIITSAHFDFRQRALESGASEFLPKPIEFDDLRRALERCVPERCAGEGKGGPPRTRAEGS